MLKLHGKGVVYVFPANTEKLGGIISSWAESNQLLQPTMVLGQILDIL